MALKLTKHHTNNWRLICFSSHLVLLGCSSGAEHKPQKEQTHYYKCNTRATTPCWLKGCEPSAIYWRLHKEIDDVYHVSIKLQRWLQSQLITGLQIDICMSDKAKLMEELAPSCAHAHVCAICLKFRRLLLSTSIPKVKMCFKWSKALVENEQKQL